MGQKLINEIGNKYGSLTVIELTKDKNNRTAWLCQCDCGKTKVVRGSDLRKGKITTCGAGCPCKTKRSAIFKDETGNKYGLLTVLKRTGTKNGKAVWLCQCECGNQCEVVGSDLRNGQQSSCGCLHSKGELKIRQILLSLKIPFKTEYTFDDLKGEKNHLRFDFAIFNNEKLLGLIEFQGKQHYYPVEHFGGIKEYEQRKKNDKKKREYCEKNNIPLLILQEEDNLEYKIKKFII